MAKYMQVSDLKEVLVCCPICDEYFDETIRLPRRMPCCIKSICHSCLENIRKKYESFLPCPICRTDNKLTDVSCLPVEQQILNIIDFVKVKTGGKADCCECGESDGVVTRCEDCCGFLCGDCEKVHRKVKLTRNHRLVTIDEIKRQSVKSIRRIHDCTKHNHPLEFYCNTCSRNMCVSCTLYEHKEHRYAPIPDAHRKLEIPFEKELDKVGANIEKFDETNFLQKEKLDNVKKSGIFARGFINEVFEKLLSNVEARRDVVLTEVDHDEEKLSSELLKAIESTEAASAAMKSALKQIIRLRETSDATEELDLMSSSSSKTLHSMARQRPRDVNYARAGVSFSPVYINLLNEIINASGIVRTVSYKDSQKPVGVAADQPYQAIVQQPPDVRPVSQADAVVSDNSEITRPYLELDPTTSSTDVNVVGSEVNNAKPEPAVQETGCQMQSARRALTNRPFLVTNRTLVQSETQLRVKEVTENKVLFELALTPDPVSSAWCQMKGLSVQIASCTTHKNKLCLHVRFHNVLVSDITLADNKVGTTLSLSLAILLDGIKRSLFIINSDKNHLMSSVTNVCFDRPFWGLMFVGLPYYTDVRGKLMPGGNVSRDLVGLLKPLC